MKIWLDDLRNPNDHGVFDHVWIVDPIEAMEHIRNNQVERISFDHDLAAFCPLTGKELNGNDVAKAIEEMAFLEELKNFPEWHVHSANPEGAKNIRATMEAAYRGFQRFCLQQDTNSPSP